MFNNLTSLLNDAIYLAPALLLTITFHEYAHGKVADMLGDPTPRANGRLTLNPITHIDPLGLIMLILVRFGWAKPVPVNPMYFRGDRRRGMLLVAVAGPLTNFFFAFVAGVGWTLAHPLFNLFGPASFHLWRFFDYFLIYNVFLGLFNLLPIPPLDGSKILASVLPPRYAYQFAQLEQYGFLILMLVLITRAHTFFLIPAANFLMSLVFTFSQYLVLPFLG
ncbi:MAG: site-2 protease family protein [Firmicutes bacterium]|nr:site-2 protease family protein [Bacillota bacterium]